MNQDMNKIVLLGFVIILLCLGALLLVFPPRPAKAGISQVDGMKIFAFAMGVPLKNIQNANPSAYCELVDQDRTRCTWPIDKNFKIQLEIIDRERCEVSLDFKFPSKGLGYLVADLKEIARRFGSGLSEKQLNLMPRITTHAVAVPQDKSAFVSYLPDDLGTGLAFFRISDKSGAICKRENKPNNSPAFWRLMD